MWGSQLPMGQEFRIEKAVISSEFNVSAKKHQGIPEFYGDDIALLKLDQKVKMSTHARPICLPCTVGPTWLCGDIQAAPAETTRRSF